MDKYFETIKKIPLFKGVSAQDLPNLLNCLSYHIKQFHKGEFIYMAGQKITSIGVVLLGSVQIIKEDAMGNRMILAHVREGNMFAEVFSCAKVSEIAVSVAATEDSTILFLNYHKLTTTCPSSCVFHSKIIENMLQIIANKNILLNQKIDCISKRTTREKILAFLSNESLKASNSEFKIPFNRQELADYLCVDRSAMSNELCKLRDEGVLSFERSHFKLLKSYYDDI